MVQTWNEKIDIIITLFGYVLIKDRPLNTNTEDEILHTMQEFYSGINSIPKEALFISLPNIIFPVNPLRKLLKQLTANKKVKPIQTTRKRQLKYLPHIRERLKIINCDRCVHVDWLDLWCNKKGRCPAFDSRQITMFMDQHHVSNYGAMYVGDYLLRLYNKFMKTRH
ncbi:hypothetical protein M3Y98_01000900 [Aphelenchoides besseyi]|nr:hypothetical protein M3Y98_01000900 [Aphelenchoides besseyi]KAI6195154.1 hypothetical protein M3Y96_01200700 [Aphelenchoides besseyi]